MIPITANPAFYTNPVTGVAAGALTLGSILAKHYVGQGRRTANTMTGQGGPQDTLNKELARISTLAETDPQAAAEQLTKAWGDFDTTTKSWIAEGGNKAKVARQALSTPALIDTVDRLAKQVGIPDLRTGGSGPPSGPTGGDINTGGSGGMTLGNATRFSTNPVSNITSKTDPGLGGGYPRSGGWGDIIKAGTDILGTVKGRTTWPGTNIPVGGPGEGPTDPNDPSTSDDTNLFDIFRKEYPDIFKSSTSSDKKKSLLDQLLPYIMLGTNIGTNAYGTKSAIDANSAAAKINSDAFLKAAQMQSDAQGNALAFQKQMYDQGRQDQAPWLASGQKALSLRDALTMNGRVQGMPNLMPSMGGR